MSEQFAMDSQEYQIVDFNEKAGFLNHEASLSSQEVEYHGRSIPQRRQIGWSIVACIFLFVFVWEHLGAIPNLFRSQALISEKDGRHMSFDTVCPQPPRTIQELKILR